MPYRRLVASLALLAATPVLGQRSAVPLNDYTRLGQRFTCTRPLVAVSVAVPSWSDNEGGLTLTLWDSPERKRALARRVVTGVVDNAMVELRPAKPLPADAYYWEVSNRTGATRIGLYSDALPLDSEDCAYLDGQPDRRRRFLYEVVGGPPPRPSERDLITALGSGDPEQQVEACRQLAVYGTAAVVPALARLLDDPALAHMARFALERIPGRAADEALRAALSRLAGGPLVGTINSVAARRDSAAVPRLSELLGNPDRAVSDAAAVALGQVGTPAAAEALGRALDVGPSPGLYEGCLRCAGRLLESGRAAEAAVLYDRLRGAPAPRAVQLAATRGAVLAGGPAGLSLLRRLLHEADPELRGVALYLVQQELPGHNVTLAVASELGELPVESKLLLIAALANRGDLAALPALELASAVGAKPVRQAAIAALPAFGAAAAPALLRLLDDPDAELRQAAENALARLHRSAAARVASDLLQSPDAAKRRVAVKLVHRLRLGGFAPSVASRLRDPASEVRLAATQALEELAGAEQIPALREALVAAAEAAEAEALERALAATAVRVGTPEATADAILAGDSSAAPPRRAALLRVLGAIGGERALTAVREAVAGPAGEVRAAALDVLCAWPSGAAAPDLLALAREAAEPAERLSALRGVLRLAAGDDLNADVRWQLCRDASDLVQRDEERLLLLSALAGIARFEGLELALTLLESPATREAACAAAVGICEKLVAAPDAARLVEPLDRVAAATGNPDLANRARALAEQARQPH